MGRFTFLLRERGVAVEGLDLSPDLVARFREFDPCGSTPVHCADVANPPAELVGQFDAVVGFMTLHHMHDLAACMRSVARLLAPGGRVAFLEPNPYNPLYYVQIAATPGMSWRAERGMLRMRARVLRDALAAAGLVGFRLRRFGFFPSFVTNRRRGAEFEDALERVPLLDIVRPFQLFGASRPPK
jgi:SAM-dependent methyltransferase